MQDYFSQPLLGKYEPRTPSGGDKRLPSYTFLGGFQEQHYYPIVKIQMAQRLVNYSLFISTDLNTTHFSFVYTQRLNSTGSVRCSVR